MSNVRYNQTDDFEIEITQNNHILIPEGIYEVQYLKHEKASLFGPKLFIWFTVVEPFEFNGVKIFKAYNFPQKINRGHYILKDCQLLAGRKLIKQEKLSISCFKNKIIKVSVRTVMQNHKQRKLMEFEQYSVVDEILKSQTGVSYSDC